MTSVLLALFGMLASVYSAFRFAKLRLAVGPIQPGPQLDCRVVNDFALSTTEGQSPLAVGDPFSGVVRVEPTVSKTCGATQPATVLATFATGAPYLIGGGIALAIGLAIGIAVAFRKRKQIAAYRAQIWRNKI